VSNYTNQKQIVPMRRQVSQHQKLTIRN